MGKLPAPFEITDHEVCAAVCCGPLVQVVLELGRFEQIKLLLLGRHAAHLLAPEGKDRLELGGAQLSLGSKADSEGLEGGIAGGNLRDGNCGILGDLAPDCRSVETISSIFRQ